MVTLNLGALAAPVGIVRLLQVVFTCISFSLVASVGAIDFSYWTWCMFTWCFCFCVTLLILLLEFTSLNARLPISWIDFTTAFAMLATLMTLAASVIYPHFFACASCGRQIGATVTSCLAFVLYAAEVGLTRARAGEISGFLATVPGLLKVLEAFVACIIFISLNSSQYSAHAGLQWCVAVYSVCFVFALLIIVCTIGRLLALFPAPFGKILTGCNVLAVLMYLTAVVVWPVYSFRGNAHPPDRVVVACMTALNLVAYIVDTVYSMRLVFFTSPA